MIQNYAFILFRENSDNDIDKVTSREKMLSWSQLRHELKAQ